MSRNIRKTDTESDQSRDTDTLWPDPRYYRYVDTLKSLVDQEIYLIEAQVTDINAGISHTGKAYKLLAVVDYPQPDPKTGLLPHMIVIDDGRGINLGRIAQITTGSAFSRSEKDLVFGNHRLLQDIFPSWKRLDKQSVAFISKALLADFLGKSESSNERLPGETDTDRSTDDDGERR